MLVVTIVTKKTFLLEFGADGNTKTWTGGGSKGTSRKGELGYLFWFDWRVLQMEL